MSDADVLRLVPLYRDVKRLRTAIIDRGGIYDSAGQLEHLIEQAILTDGKLVQLQAGITANDMLIHVGALVERIETLKAALDEAAS